MNQENLPYPFMGLGSNSNSVASTLVACMGKPEPDVTGWALAPGRSTILLTPTQIQSVQSANGINTGPYTDASVPEIQSIGYDTQGNIVIVDKSSKGTEITTIGPDKTTQEHYDNNGYLTAKQDITEDSSGKIHSDIVGSDIDSTLSNADITVQANSVIQFDGSGNVIIGDFDATLGIQGQYDHVEIDNSFIEWAGHDFTGDTVQGMNNNVSFDYYTGTALTSGSGTSDSRAYGFAYEESSATSDRLEKNHVTVHVSSKTSVSVSELVNEIIARSGSNGHKTSHGFEYLDETVLPHSPHQEVFVVGIQNAAVHAVN